jgi:hypothetical protein
MRIGLMLTLEQQITEVAAREQFLQVRASIEQQIERWYRDNLPTSALERDAALPSLLTRTMIAFTDGFFLASQIDATEASVPSFVALVVDVLERMTTPDGK